MSDNRMAEALLEVMPYPDKRYSPLVLICKNGEVGKQLLDRFKEVCADEKIILTDGCASIINDSITDFTADQNVCVMFENLQKFAGNQVYEQRFFEIFNSAFEKSAAILITLNDNIRHFPFEGRNRSRLLWGIKEEIT